MFKIRVFNLVNVLLSRTARMASVNIEKQGLLLWQKIRFVKNVLKT